METYYTSEEMVVSFYWEDLERDLLEYEGMTGYFGNAWEPQEELRWQEDNPPPFSFAYWNEDEK